MLREEGEEHLMRVEGWTLADGAIEKNYKFARARRIKARL